jgi:Domain of unknown function (DUF4260)
MWVAVIWAAYIGFDRMIGYGLKYSSGFKHTHLAIFWPSTISAGIT